MSFMQRRSPRINNVLDTPPPIVYTSNLTGGLSFTGSFVRRTTHGLSAGLSFTGNLVKKLSRTLTVAALSFTGNIARGSAHFLSFSGGLSFSGVFNKFPTKNMIASASFTGSLKKATSSHFTANLNLTGAFGKGMFKVFSATLGFIGTFLGQLLSHFRPKQISVSSAANTGEADSDSRVATINSGATIESVTGFTPDGEVGD